MTPFFSIITATYNAGQSLPFLLEALAGQTCRDFELVIQDAASTDNTLEVAAAFREKLPFLNIASEKDRGIYDAWNKAVARASGEWALFLGADDAPLSGTVLGEVKGRLEKAGPEIGFAPGWLRLQTENGFALRYKTASCPDVLESLRGCRMPYSFPSMFMRRSVLEKFPFNPEYRIAGDFEFLCRAMRGNSQVLELPLAVSAMIEGGVSNSPRRAFKTFQETALAARSTLGLRGGAHYFREYGKSRVISACYQLLGDNLGARARSAWRALRRAFSSYAEWPPRDWGNKGRGGLEQAAVFVAASGGQERLKAQLAWLEERNLREVIILGDGPARAASAAGASCGREGLPEQGDGAVVPAPWRCGEFAQALSERFFLVVRPEFAPEDFPEPDAVYNLYNLLGRAKRSDRASLPGRQGLSGPAPLTLYKPGARP